MNLRIDPHTRQPIDQAAAALGKTRTEFIVDTAKRAAIDMLLDRRLSFSTPMNIERSCTPWTIRPRRDPSCGRSCAAHNDSRKLVARCMRNISDESVFTWLVPSSWMHPPN
jgi:uncharacterized protein DUF1778